MKLIDLTLPINSDSDEVEGLREEALDLKRYTAMIHYFNHSGMAGTYIDFPGHIRETDDGQHAANYPAEKLFRVDTTVIRLDRESGSGKISAEELQQHCPHPIHGGALLLNALGTRRFDEIEQRSVYLAREAAEWIVETGIHLFVSDVYESNTDPQDVFLHLFRAGIATVCCPINLHQLAGPSILLTALPLRFQGVTQLPCRILAEDER